MFFPETIERFPKNKRFVYLIILHYSGLVSIPNYHPNKWLNLLHKYVYRSFVYFCISVTILTQAFVIFFYAIHDISQFLQRLAESLFLIIFFVPIFRYNLNIQAVIDLLKQMDRIFDPPNKKYEKSELLVMKSILAFLVCILLVNTWDTFSALSEQEEEYLVRIYHMDNPRRKLPLCFMPIDLNNTATYAMACVFQFYIWMLWEMSVFQILMLETMFTSPVQDQFELLCEDIERIGERSDSMQELDMRDPRKTVTARGVLVQETDIDQSEIMTVSKQVHINMKQDNTKNKQDNIKTSEQDNTKNKQDYIKTSEEDSTKYKQANIQRKKANTKHHDIKKKQANMKTMKNERKALMDRKNQQYEAELVRQVIKRNQLLDNYVNQYHNIFRYCGNPMVYPTVMLLPLATYQLVIVPQLPATLAVKKILEFCFINFGSINLIMQSEKLDNCYRGIVRAILNSKWYLTSARVRKSVQMMLRVCQKPHITVLYNGLISLDKEFFVQNVKLAYTFVNFVLLMNKRG